MKKSLYLSSVLLVVAVFAVIAFVPTTNVHAQTVTCPPGYVCTPVQPTTVVCPPGYVCQPVNGSTSIPTYAGNSVFTGNSTLYPNTDTYSSGSCYMWSTNLDVGSRGADVVALQTWLIANGYDIPAISSGMVAKGYFGSATKAALMQYQTANGMTATGSFGPTTREKVNSVSCSVTSTPVTPVSNPTNPVPATPVQAYPVSSSGSYSTLPVDPNITGNVYLTSANEDRVYKWNGTQVHSPDWKWSITVTNRGTTTKYISRMILLHNASGEGWATDGSAINPLGKVLRLGAVTTCDFCDIFNQYTNSLNLAVTAGGSKSMYMYGEPASMTFSGGNLVVEFTDNTSATISIPASTITPNSSSIYIQPVNPVICPAGYICTPPGSTQVCPIGYVCLPITVNCPSGYTCATYNLQATTTPPTAVSNPQITIISPNGGENFTSGQVVNFYGATNYPVKQLVAYLYSPTNGNVATMYPTFTWGSTSGRFQGSVNGDTGIGIGVGQYKINVCDELTPSPLGPGKTLCDSSNDYFNVTLSNSGSTVTQTYNLQSVNWNNFGSVTADSYLNPRVNFGGADMIPYNDNVTATEWCKHVTGKTYNSGTSQISSVNPQDGDHYRFDGTKWVKIGNADYPRTYQCANMSGGQATLSIDPVSPLASTQMVGNTAVGTSMNVPVLTFDINSSIPAMLRGVRVVITKTGAGSITAAYLFQGSTLISSASVVNDGAIFQNTSAGTIGNPIPANATVPYTVKVDVSGITTSSSMRISASLPSSRTLVQTAGGASVYVTGSATGNTVTISNGVVSSAGQNATADIYQAIKDYFNSKPIQ